MCRDALRQRLVLFGGFDEALPAELGDTWEWDGSAWSLRATTGPAPRADAAMAFDGVRGRVVLYGGYRPSASTAPPFADTWEWDGVAWVLCSPAHAPGPNAESPMVFDERHQVCLLVTTVGLTWQWNGVDWTRALPINNPPYRQNAAMAWDRLRERAVLFGGRGTVANLADTWTWDGANWTHELPMHNPSARRNHAMAYDERRGRVVLHGGGIAPFTVANVFADTWEWDGIDWLQRTPTGSPGRRFLHSLCDDPGAGKVVLFGGEDALVGQTNDLWQYGPLQPGLASEFGFGCAGSLPAPHLVPLLAAWVGIGEPLEARGLPPGTGCFRVTGFSASQWLGMPLPVDLAPYGFPGCSSWISAEFTRFYFDGDNDGRIRVDHSAFPPGAFGITYFDQVIALDPAHPRGIVVTNAQQATVGLP